MPESPARVLIVGAGAIGASVGALLYESGVDVTLVARGPHGRALRASGLDLRLPAGPRRVRVPCAAALRELAPTGDDLIVISAMGHDTQAALEGAPARATVVSLQNGTLPLDVIVRHGHPLIAGMVYIPAERRGAGIVALSGQPHPGTVLLGSWGGHTGDLDRARWFADRLTEAGFVAEVEADVSPWIRAKLLANLAGIAVALCDPPADEVAAAARCEARAVWDAADLPFRSVEELSARVGVQRVVDVDGLPRIGGSTRHALSRGQRLETASLHGPICALGRLLGVPTVVNDALVELADRAYQEGWRPGSLRPEDLLR